MVQARISAGKSIGFDDTYDGSIAATMALNPERQIELTYAVEQLILAHPEDFTAAQVAVATAHTPDYYARQQQGIVDTGFDTGLFIDTALVPVRRVGDALVNIGNSVVSTAETVGMISKFIPLILVAVVVLIVIKKSKPLVP